MRIDYLNIPELADKRHIIVDGKRTVNTAAKPSNIIYLFDRGRVIGRDEDKKTSPSIRLVIEFVDNGTV